MKSNRDGMKINLQMHSSINFTIQTISGTVDRSAPADKSFCEKSQLSWCHILLIISINSIDCITLLVNNMSEEEADDGETHRARSKAGNLKPNLNEHIERGE